MFIYWSLARGRVRHVREEEKRVEWLGHMIGSGGYSFLHLWEALFGGSETVAGKGDKRLKC